jgi:hypothetical protein
MIIHITSLDTCKRRFELFDVLINSSCVQFLSFKESSIPVSESFWANSFNHSTTAANSFNYSTTATNSFKINKNNIKKRKLFKLKQTSACRGTTIGGPGKDENGARRINSSWFDYLKIINKIK